jgi:hypothetical protein
MPSARPGGASVLDLREEQPALTARMFLLSAVKVLGDEVDQAA